MAIRVSGREMSDPNGGLATSQHGRRAGDVQLEELYTAYARRVRALARRRLADPQQAEDAVQETFLHAYRGLPGLDPARPAWPWLARIATNVCFDMMRHQQAHPDHNCLDVDDFTDLVPARGADPAARCVAAEDRRAIATALDAVCQRQRRVLMLREVEGWRYDDIASLEGMTLDALKGALKRARQSFRESYAAVVEAGGGLIAALSPRRAWRWLRIRTREVVERVQETVGSIASWSAIPLGQVSGLVTAATVAIAAAAIGGTAPPAGGRVLLPGLAATKGASALMNVAGNAGPANVNTGSHPITVGAPVPPVAAALVPVGASASALRPRDPNFSKGIALLKAEAPVLGHYKDQFSYLVQCKHDPAQQAMCAALDAIPDPR